MSDSHKVSLLFGLCPPSPNLISPRAFDAHGWQPLNAHSMHREGDTVVLVGYRLLSQARLLWWCRDAHAYSFSPHIDRSMCSTALFHIRILHSEPSSSGHQSCKRVEASIFSRTPLGRADLGVRAQCRPDTPPGTFRRAAAVAGSSVAYYVCCCLGSPSTTL